MLVSSTRKELVEFRQDILTTFFLQKVPAIERPSRYGLRGC